MHHVGGIPSSPQMEESYTAISVASDVRNPKVTWANRRFRDLAGLGSLLKVALRFLGGEVSAARLHCRCLLAHPPGQIRVADDRDLTTIHRKRNPAPTPLNPKPYTLHPKP